MASAACGGDVPATESGLDAGPTCGTGRIPTMDWSCHSLVGCQAVNPSGCGCRCTRCDNEQCVEQSCEPQCPFDAGIDTGRDAGGDHADAAYDAQDGGAVFEDAGRDAGSDSGAERDGGTGKDVGDSGPFDTGGWGQFPKAVGGDRDDVANSVIQTSDNGYLLAGATQSFGASGWDAWVVKFNATAEIEWQNTLGGDGDEQFTSALEITTVIAGETTSDGYLAVGSTASSGAGGRDIWVVRLGADGSVRWQKTLGGTGNDDAQRVIRTVDGGFALVGNTTSFTTHGAIWVIKFDGDGEVVWTRTFSATDGDVKGYDISSTPEGHLLVAGMSSDGFAWAFQISPDGTTGADDWETRLGVYLDGSGHIAIATSIVPVEDGTFMLAGATNISGMGGFDLWVSNLDNAGPYAGWEMTLGGTKDDGGEIKAGTTPTRILPTADYGYVIAGSTKSFGAGSSDFWALKLDWLGDVEWQKIFGGAGRERLLSLEPAGDGGFLLAGTTNSFGAGLDDAWVLRLNTDGNIFGTCPQGMGLTTDADWDKGGSWKIEQRPDTATQSITPVDSTGVPGLSAAVDTAQCGAPPEWLCVSTGDPAACGPHAACISNSCACLTGYTDCDLTWSDRCEVNTGADTQNCGECGKICEPINVGQPLCLSGGCDYDACVPPFTDADGDRTNGCEMGTYFPRDISGKIFNSPGGDLQPTTDGGFILVGRYQYWMLLMKLDQAGSTVWAKEYENFDGIVHGYRVRQTADGGYIVAGSAKTYSENQYDIMLVKLGSDGAVEWNRRYSDDTATALTVMNDGGYTVAGSEKVIRVDSTGAALWQKTVVSDRASSAQIRSIAKTPDGGLIVGGESCIGSACTLKSWLMKLSAAGAVEWQRQYGGFDNEEGRAVVTTGDGGYLLAGQAGDYTGDLRVLKLKPDGSIEWQKKYVGDGGDQFYDAVGTPAGGIAVIGNSSDWDMIVQLVGPDGAVLSRKTFLFGGYYSTIGAIPGGGFTAVGRWSGIAAIKLLPDGSLDGVCTRTLQQEQAVTTVNTVVSASNGQVNVVNGTVEEIPLTIDISQGRYDNVAMCAAP